jgi:hypothetical protein
MGMLFTLQQVDGVHNPKKKKKKSKHYITKTLDVRNGFCRAW